MKLDSIAYISPMLHYDRGTQLTVIQYRHGDTGKVTQQFPSEKSMREYRAALTSSVAAAALPLLGVVDALKPPAAAPSTAPAPAPTPKTPAAPTSVSITV